METNKSIKILSKENQNINQTEIDKSIMIIRKFTSKKSIVKFKASNFIMKSQSIIGNKMGKGSSKKNIKEYNYKKNQIIFTIKNCTINKNNKKNIINILPINNIIIDS